jgi:ActR/RegA family two-component response regulator
MPIEVNHFSSTDYISVGTQLTVRIPTTTPAFSLLLVDGNMSSLVRQQRMLSNSGYRVITATTCNEIMSLRRTAIQLAVLNETLGTR